MDEKLPWYYAPPVTDVFASGLPKTMPEWAFPALATAIVVAAVIGGVIYATMLDMGEDAL